MTESPDISHVDLAFHHFGTFGSMYNLWNVFIAEMMVKYS